MRTVNKIKNTYDSYLKFEDTGRETATVEFMDVPFDFIEKLKKNKRIQKEFHRKIHKASSQILKEMIEKS